MTNKEIEKFLKRAKSAATAMGFKGDAEDYAQDVLLKFLLKPDSKQTVDQAVIDAVRKDRGGKNRKTGTYEDCPKAGDRNVPLKAARHVEYRKGAPRTGMVPIDRDLLTVLGHLLKRELIERGDHAAFILMYGWELTGAEIGVLFGVTQSQMCKRIVEVEKRIIKALLRECK